MNYDLDDHLDRESSNRTGGREGGDREEGVEEEEEGRPDRSTIRNFR